MKIYEFKDISLYLVRSKIKSNLFVLLTMETKRSSINSCDKSMHYYRNTFKRMRKVLLRTSKFLVCNKMQIKVKIMLQKTTGSTGGSSSLVFFS